MLWRKVGQGKGIKMLTWIKDYLLKYGDVWAQSWERWEKKPYEYLGKSSPGTKALRRQEYAALFGKQQDHHCGWAEWEEGGRRRGGQRNAWGRMGAHHIRSQKPLCRLCMWSGKLLMVLSSGVAFDSHFKRIALATVAYRRGKGWSQGSSSGRTAAVLAGDLCDLDHSGRYRGNGWLGSEYGIWRSMGEGRVQVFGLGNWSCHLLMGKMEMGGAD